MAIYSYDPFNSILIIDGYRVTQFAEGTMLTIETIAEDYTAYHGATGEGWVKNKDQGVKIGFTLIGDSADNAVLSAKRQAQRLAPAPAFESSYSEVLGTTEVAAHRCRFTKFPQIERGTDMPKPQWEVTSLTADTFIGGMT